MHSDGTDNVACGGHQQHACLQRNQPVMHPRLAPRAPHSLWQLRACQATTIAMVSQRNARRGAGRAGRGGWAVVGGLTSLAQAGQIRPVVVALASCCARCPCVDVAERTTPASRHVRRQDLEKYQQQFLLVVLFQVSLSASITRGSSVFHKSLKRGQRAPVAFGVVSHLLPLHQLDSREHSRRLLHHQGVG